MILRDVPAVALPKSWITTLCSWPTLLQHLQRSVVITSNFRIYTYPLPPLLFGCPAVKGACQALKVALTG